MEPTVLNSISGGVHRLKFDAILKWETVGPTFARVGEVDLLVGLPQENTFGLWKTICDFT